MGGECADSALIGVYPECALRHRHQGQVKKARQRCRRRPQWIYTLLVGNVQVSENVSVEVYMLRLMVSLDSYVDMDVSAKHTKGIGFLMCGCKNEGQ